jgi:hypothetical protein
MIEQNSRKGELSLKSNIDKLVSKLMQLHIEHQRIPLCTTQCKQLMLAAWSALHKAIRTTKSRRGPPKLMHVAILDYPIIQRYCPYF